jgi:CBS domain-containing protein
MEVRMMKVSDLRLEPLLGTRLDEPLADAADRMNFYAVGSLAVVDSGNVIGILTERDIVRAIADRVEMERIPVRSFVTPSPATVSSDADVEDAATLMLSLGVRHLPVIDCGRPVGMVSIRDLLGAELALAANAPC